MHIYGLVSYTVRMDDKRIVANKVIDHLGGTVAVAQLCHVTKGAVSQWRINGLPDGRMQFLETRCPELFLSFANQSDANLLPEKATA